jgi:large subunit ribosomal protein L25
LLTLSCEPRGLTKSARSDARRRGYVPAVVYGKGMEPAPIMVPFGELREALKHSGRNKLIRLEGAGVGQPRTVLIKDMAVDEVHDSVIHVDFFQPAAGRKIRIRVPVRLQGEEDLSKRGLILTHQLHEVEVECLPDEVPAALVVNVRGYEPGAHVSLGDLQNMAGVRICSPLEMVVANIEVPLATMIPGEGAANVTTA